MKISQVISTLLITALASGAKIEPEMFQSFQSQAWNPNSLCQGDPSFWRFADFSCSHYWECQTDGNALLYECVGGKVYDEEWEGCYSRNDGAICWSDDRNQPDPKNPDKNQSKDDCTMKVENVKNLVVDLQGKIDRLLSDMTAIKKMFYL